MGALRFLPGTIAMPSGACGSRERPVARFIDETCGSLPWIGRTPGLVASTGLERVPSVTMVFHTLRVAAGIPVDDGRLKEVIR